MWKTNWYNIFLDWSGPSLKKSQTVWTILLKDSELAIVLAVCLRVHIHNWWFYLWLVFLLVTVEGCDLWLWHSMKNFQLLSCRELWTALYLHVHSLRMNRHNKAPTYPYLYSYSSKGSHLQTQYFSYAILLVCGVCVNFYRHLSISISSFESLGDMRSDASYICLADFDIYLFIYLFFLAFVW